MEYQSGDVRDTEVLHEAFRDADVVVHLAFLIVGGKRATTRAINVDGTLNAFRAAAAAEARRFVYASSVAAYGFHRDNPVGMTEEWPTRPADTLFYSQEKAELEQLLRAESTFHPDLDLYLLRPSIVLGPHAAGAKELLPEPLASLARGLREQIRRLPLPVPTPVPDLPVQFVHSDDVGRALRQCVFGAGPPGAYNIAGDGVLSTVDVARELGIKPVPVPARPVRAAARATARLPFLPSTAEWVEAMSRPAIMETRRAKTELGWFTAVHRARCAARDHRAVTATSPGGPRRTSGGGELRGQAAVVRVGPGVLAAVVVSADHGSNRRKHSRHHAGRSYVG